MGHKWSKHHGHYKTKSFKSTSQGLSATKSQPARAIRSCDTSTFAVITVIFNPIKYQSRYNHYQKFEAHMTQSGVHLITVECLFESAPRFNLPKQNFEITRAGDRRHIQLRAPSILWMKENLINIAVQRLPQHIEYVAWIDADIEFERLDWPQLAINELQRYPIVQLFEVAFFLGPTGINEILRRDYSFGYSIRHNKPINPMHSNDWYAHPGYAWAMRRTAFTAIGGLLDFCIIGSGDLHFAFALLHRIEETIRPTLHQDYRKLAITWGDKVAQVAQNGANVGYVPVNLWHYWHGERNDRNYVNRWAILEKHKFSPLNDLVKNEDTGLLRLADKNNFGNYEMAARIEALEADIVAYFKSRNEDSTRRTAPVQPPAPVKKKPLVPAKNQSNRSGGGLRSTRFQPSRTGGGREHQIWSSGPAGTHVDDHNSYLDQCTCPGHHHHCDNHICPCSPHHMGDQQCCDSSEHHHHHHDDHNLAICLPSNEHHHHHDDHHHHHGDHNLAICPPSNEHHHHHDDHHHHRPEYNLAVCPPSNEHHHHHTDDNFGGHHSSHGHDDHGGWGNDGNSGYTHDHSSDGGGFSTTDYGGPGSFY